MEPSAVPSLNKTYKLYFYNTVIIQDASSSHQRSLTIPKPAQSLSNQHHHTHKTTITVTTASLHLNINSHLALLAHHPVMLSTIVHLNDHFNHKQTAMVTLTSMTPWHSKHLPAPQNQHPTVPRDTR